MDEWITRALVHTRGDVWAASQIVIALAKRPGDTLEKPVKPKSARTDQSSQSADSDQYSKPKIEDIPVDTQKIILKEVIMDTPPKRFVDVVMRVPFFAPNVDFNKWFQSKEDPQDELTIEEEYRRKWYIPVIFHVLRPSKTIPLFFVSNRTWGTHDPYRELKLYLPNDMSFEDTVKQFEEQIRPENTPYRDLVESDLFEYATTPPNDTWSQVLPDKSVPLKNIMAFYKRNLEPDTISKWVKHGYEDPTENLLIFYPEYRMYRFDRIFISDEGYLLFEPM